MSQFDIWMIYVFRFVLLVHLTEASAEMIKKYMEDSRLG